MEDKQTGSNQEQEAQGAGAPASEEQNPVVGEQGTEQEEINPYETQLNELQSKLDKETKEKENLKTALHNERQSNKKDNQDGDQGEDDEVKRAEQFVVDHAKKVLAPELARLEKAMTANTRKSLISQMTSNTKEQELIEFHLDNSIVSSGDLESDLKNAWALANMHKVEQVAQKRVDDIHRRGVQANDANALAGGNSSGRRYETDNVKLSQADIDLARKFGRDEKWLRERMKSS